MLGKSITYGVNWNELLNRIDIINRGIGNDITQGFLARMKYMYNAEPGICFIIGGINDIFIDIELITIASNLEEIIIDLKSKEIKSIM